MSDQSTGSAGREDKTSDEERPSYDDEHFGPDATVPTIDISPVSPTLPPPPPASDIGLPEVVPAIGDDEKPSSRPSPAADEDDAPAEDASASSGTPGTPGTPDPPDPPDAPGGESGAEPPPSGAQDGAEVPLQPTSTPPWSGQSAADPAAPPAVPPPPPPPPGAAQPPSVPPPPAMAQPSPVAPAAPVPPSAPVPPRPPAAAYSPSPPGGTPSPAQAPPVQAPPAQAPPTQAPPPQAPPAQAPPTQAPPTQAPPTQAPPTQAPPTQAPPTQAPPPQAPAPQPGQQAPGYRPQAQQSYAQQSYAQPSYPAAPQVPDAHGVGIGFSRISPGAQPAARPGATVLAAVLEEGDVVDLLIQGNVRGRSGVAALVGPKLVLANAREWEPEVVTLPITSTLQVQGMQQGTFATLVLTDGETQEMVDRIGDAQLAIAMAERIRARIATATAEG